MNENALLLFRVSLYLVECGYDKFIFRKIERPSNVTYWDNTNGKSYIIVTPLENKGFSLTERYKG